MKAVASHAVKEIICPFNAQLSATNSLVDASLRGMDAKGEYVATMA